MPFTTLSSEFIDWKFAAQNEKKDQLDKALKAIDGGSYGICLKCKKEIESGRLEIMPYAELCISCRKAEGK